MAMRQNSPDEVPSLPMYIHDGFNIQQYSLYLSGHSDFVIEDHHSYVAFTPTDDSEPASQHTSDVRGAISSDLGLATAKARRNLVIGEWLCVLTTLSLSTQHDPDGARRRFARLRWAYMRTRVPVGHFGVRGLILCPLFLASHGNNILTESTSVRQGRLRCGPRLYFKAAVWKSPPDTFFSYRKPPPLDPAAFQRAYSAVASMTSPSQSDSLRRLGSSPMVIQGDDPIAPWQATASQRSFVRGYSDGYRTAKIFAQHGWSRLGFTEQYIQDSLNAMGGEILRGTGDYYCAAFKTGLADGEAVVLVTLS